MRATTLLLSAILLVGAPAAACAEHVYESARLRISGDVPEAWIDEAATLGKQLHAALSAHFGRAPDGKQLPLELVLYPRRSAFDKALRLQGVKGDAEHAGGWTVWKNGVSHVWLQKEPFDTRRLILHELFHQFHDKCRDYSRRADGAWWYREGLAEWFGWHRRTAGGLVFGALDAVAMNALARRAAARVKAADFDPWAVAMGRTKASYVDALALVGGLMLAKDKDLRARFRLWQRKVLAQGGDVAAFRTRFAERRKDLKGALQIGWATLGGQWQPSRFGWDDENGVIRVQKGTPSTTLMRVGRPSVGSLSVRVEIVTGTEPGATAGVICTFPGGHSIRVDVSEKHFSVRRLPLRVGGPPSGDGFGVSLGAGRKTVLDLVIADGRLRVHATRGGVRETIESTDVPRGAVTGWGLTVDNTGARFRLLPPDRGK